MAQWNAPGAEAAPAPAAPAVVAATAPPVAADAPSAPLTAPVRGQRVEDLSKRTQDSTTWTNPDGSFTSELFTGPVRMRDAAAPSGWVDLDPTLVRAADGSVAPKAHPEFLKLSGPVASTAGTTSLISQVDPGDPLTASPLTRSRARTLSWGWPGRLPAPVLEGTKATYPDVRPNMDLVVEATTTGFEQFLVVKVRPTNPGDAAMTLPVATRGLSLAADGQGGVRIKDATGAARGRMPAPVMWDARRIGGSDIPADRKPVGMTVTQATTGQATVKLTPDSAFLMDPTTRYPVTIDPSSTLSASFDTFVQSDIPNYDFSTMDLLLSGSTDTRKRRSFLTFPLPFKGAVVTAATMNLFENYSLTCTPKAVDVHVALPANTATRWANQPYINPTVFSRVTASKGFSAACPAGTLSFNAKTLAQYWADTTSTVQAYAIQAASETDLLGFKEFWPSERATGRPYMSVTYNRYPNTAGTPTHTPGTSSATATPGWTATTTPTLKATVSDPDGGNVTGMFSVWKVGGSAVPVIDGMAGTTVASGGVSTLVVPPGRLVNGSYYQVWSYGNDGTLVSKAWSVGYDFFTVDTTAPNPPTVSSTTWTAGAWAAANSGVITWSDVSPDVVSYAWKIDTGAWTAPTTATSRALSGLAPDREHTFSVRATDRSAHTSAVTDFTFGVGVQCSSSGSRAASQPLTHQLSDSTKMSLNPTNGNLLLSGSLLHLGGVGQDLNIGWRYNGLGDTRPTLSAGLSETALKPWADGSFSHVAPDGGCYTFIKSGTSWATPAGINATLTSPVAGTMTLRFNPSGIVNTYVLTGGVYQLTRSADKNTSTPNLITYTYTAGKLTSIIDTQGRTVTFAYADVRNLTQPSTITDTSMSRTIALAYGGPAGALSQVTDATGAVSDFGYDATGLISLTNNANQTTFGYDPASRLTSWTYGAGSPDASDWAAAYGASTTITDGNSNAATYTTISTPTGLKTTITDPLGHAIGSDWDTHDNLTKRTDAMGNLTVNVYNPNNLLKKITSPAGTTGGTGAAQELTFPTAVTGGLADYQPTGTKDAQDNTSAIGYDPNTRQANSVTSKSAAGVAIGGAKTVTIQGDLAGTDCGAKTGQVCTTSNGNNNITTFGYDGSGNPTSITPPAPLGSRAFTYDPAGRVVTGTDGRGNTARYSYDANGRTTQVSQAATGCPAATCVAYTYDDAGNLTSRTSPTGVTGYTYDALNRPTTKTQAGVLVSTATYDPASNLTSHTDTTGTTAYGYDSANRLVSLAEPGGSCPTAIPNIPAPANATKCTFFGYDNANRRTGTTFPTGQTSTRVYDNAGRAKTVTAKTAALTILASRAYTYQTAVPGGADQALRATMTDQTGTTTYGYDGLNRLTKATKGTTISGWTYDNDGNRTTATKTGTPTVFSAFNGADQLCWSSTTNATGCGSAPAGATTYAYDATGNQTSDKVAGPTLSNTFNVFNQLTDTLIGGATTQANTYADTGNTERLTAGATSFLNGTLGLTAQTTSGATTSFIRDPYGNLIVMRTNGQSYYYTADAQGSVIALTSSTQAPVATYSYDPWGNTTGTGTLAATNPWTYATGYKDAATGYLKLGARYYNPTTGRFTQPDPSGQEPNNYNYASCNPTNNTDPTGRQSCATQVVKTLAGSTVVAGIGLVGIALGPESLGSSVVVAAGAVGAAGLVAEVTCLLGFS